MQMRASFLLALAALSLTFATTSAHGADAALTKGRVELKNAGAMAFGPGDILLVADAKAAAIYAIDTGEPAKNAGAKSLNLSSVDSKIAAALGTTADDILINDMVVKPASAEGYLSVSRGRGPNAQAVLIRVSPSGDISEVALDNVAHAKAALPNPPEDKLVQRGRRKSNPRTESITDIEYRDGKVLVAGLSSEEFASTFRAIPYPFKNVDKGVTVEIYHASHGAFETRSPIRTFTTYKIGDEPHLLAGYTCTPLVKFPLNELKPGGKVRGVTLAELGNRNRPLDMFVYNKGGDDYILMSNNNRGVMKISTKDMARDEGLTDKVRDKAGQQYETIESLNGVVQLDRLDEKHAVVLIKSGSTLDLKTVELP